MKPTRPILRYHGGKWRLARWILEHLPPHRVYVEPYGGAGSVLMQKPRSFAEVINDLHAEIVTVFRVLRDPELAERLSTSVYLTPYARDEYDETFEEADASLDDVESARRTLVRSFMGFASASVTRVYKSGFRNNATRNGTVPAVDWARYPFHVESFVERLRGVVVENRPALEMIAQFDTPETLFYLDPPYPMSTRWKSRDSTWVKDSYHYEMTDTDHMDLADAAWDVKGLVVISTYPCPLYDALYHGWQRVEHEVQIEGSKRTGAGPRFATEVLFLSPRASSLLGGQARLIPFPVAGASA